MSMIPDLESMTDEQKLQILESIQKSIRESKEIQKRKVGENVQAVIAALRKIESDVTARFDSVAQTIETRVANIKDGRDGAPGADGRPGRDGKDGRPGRDGKDGKDGAPGRDGVPGMDGVSVTNAFLDFDNSLVIELSNGLQINAGEVLPPDIAEKLKVVVNTSTGGVGLPEQTGNTGKFLKTDGVNLLWDTVGGGGGGGDVTGPASAVDNAIARYDGTTGKVIQNSSITVSDAGDMSGVSSLGVANYIDFDTTPTVTNAVGRMYWNAAQNSVSVGLTSTLATDVGQTLYARATNAEAVTINKGQVVYAFGAVGDRLSVKLAFNTSDATSAKTIGVAAENITAGGTGMIICQGVLEGLNLGAFTAGDSIYLGSTAGSITATKPYAPNHLVYVGTVERANAGNGRLYVRIQNGYEMDELHNVSAQNPTNGQILIYNQSTSLWEKANITAGSNITVTNGAGSITIAATGGAAGDVVGPASSTDNAVVRFDGTTGKLVQNSSFVVNDAGEVTTGVWKGTELTVPYGGTGSSTLAQNNVLLGNGSSALQTVAPGTSGNVLTSDGTTWISSAAAGGGLTYLYTTTGITLTDKQGALADTSGGAFTVTLPASPATGAQVVVADAGSSWGTNNLTVGRNGSTIGGLAENLVCDITGASVQLVYDGTTWEVYAQVGGNGGNAVTLDGVQTLTNKTLSDPLLSLGGTNGTVGQVPVSQGAGLAPVWGSVASGAQPFVTQHCAGDNGVPSLQSAPANFGLI